MKEKIIKIPIYHWKLHIIKWDLEKIGKKYNLHNIQNYDAVTFALYWKSWDYHIFICFSNNIENTIIAHECCHWVNLIFKYNWIKIDLDNDEPQAYLLGWLVWECNKFLAKSK